jgi:retinol-binding protein 3
MFSALRFGLMALALGSVPGVSDERARELVLQAAETIENLYVEADRGKAIAEELRRRVAKGRYDGSSTVTALADRLAADLQEVGKDKHLSARYDPDRQATMRRVVREGPPGADPHSSAGPVVVRREGHPTDPARAERDRRRNYGFQELRRLDGNVGYLALSEIAPIAFGRDTAAGAMAFLAASDAIIIDLRDCPGGAADTVTFLASYFFGPERKELFSRQDRAMGDTTVEYTVEDLPGRRMPEKDLWILVGPGTASAGESLAYLLQQFGRATVVGARTAGAGYNVALLPIGDGLVLGVSVAKPIHPKTGKGWEGEGVRPDVAVAAGDALATAHAAALRKLAADASDARRRRELEWALERAARSASLSAATLAALAGRYGERTVAVDSGRLVCRAPNGRSRVLDPVGTDASASTFTWDEETRATFDRDASGRATALVLERVDGTIERFPRKETR